MVFEAEEWKFSERFLRLVEGEHVVAQFPTRNVLGVWFEEHPATIDSAAEFAAELSVGVAVDDDTEDVSGEQTEA